MRVQYPKLYNMTHLLALNVSLLPKDLTIIFIQIKFDCNWPCCLQDSKCECTHGRMDDDPTTIL